MGFVCLHFKSFACLNQVQGSFLQHCLGLASRAYLVPIQSVHGPGYLELLGGEGDTGPLVFLV